MAKNDVGGESLKADLNDDPMAHLSNAQALAHSSGDPWDIRLGWSNTPKSGNTCPSSE